MDNSDVTRAPGRPRDEKAKEAILVTTYNLLTESGLQGLSVDEIARKARVSKNTIYRWWPTKAAVLMDAFAHAMDGKLDFPDAGDAVGRFSAQISNVMQLMNDPKAGLVFGALVAASLHDAELAAALRDRFITMRREKALTILDMAFAHNPGFDTEVMIDMVYGAIYYRLLISRSPLDDDYSSRLSDVVARLVKASN